MRESFHWVGCHRCVVVPQRSQPAPARPPSTASRGAGNPFPHLGETVAFFVRSVTTSGRTVVLTVDDDGISLDTWHAGVGLASMRERAVEAADGVEAVRVCTVATNVSMILVKLHLAYCAVAIVKARDAGLGQDRHVRDGLSAARGRSGLAPTR